MAQQICTRTAFSVVPQNRLILRCCLIHLKNFYDFLADSNELQKTFRELVNRSSFSAAPTVVILHQQTGRIMYIDKFQIEEMFRKIMEHAKLQQAHLEDELRLLRSQMPEQPAKYTPKNPIKPKLNCLTIKDIR